MASGSLQCAVNEGELKRESWGFEFHVTSIQPANLLLRLFLPSFQEGFHLKSPETEWEEGRKGRTAAGASSLITDLLLPM